jgi:hypothetical protein
MEIKQKDMMTMNNCDRADEDQQEESSRKQKQYDRKIWCIMRDDEGVDRDCWSCRANEDKKDYQNEMFCLRDK